MQNIQGMFWVYSENINSIGNCPSVNFGWTRCNFWVMWFLRRLFRWIRWRWKLFWIANDL